MYFRERTLVVLPSRSADHEAAEFNADGHVCYHEGNGLVVDDGCAHGLALFGVAEGGKGGGWCVIGCVTCDV